MEPTLPSRTDQFASTHWSVVLRAGHDGSPEAGEALEKLCRAYWQPLFVFARRLGQTVHDAQDVTQAFFAHFLAKGYIRAADPVRGRFRTFLLTSFRHFMEGEWTKTRAVKRGGQNTIVSWEELALETEAEAEPAHDISPEKLFDQQWAAKVFAQALRQLREQFEVARKIEQFERLKKFLSVSADQVAYGEAGQSLGMSAQAVAVAVHRLRHRYGELVRAEIAQTVSREDDVENELRYLMEVMAD